MDRLVPKSHLHCLQSHTMLSVNRLRPPRVLSKVTLANKLSRSLNNSLEHSPLHRTSSLRTTQRIPNAMPRTTATTSNSMACSKERKDSKTAQLSNDHSVDTMVLKLRELLNFPRAQLNKPHLAMQLPAVKEAVTTLPTQLPRLSSKELAKAHNLNSNLATHNNLKPATTPMAIPTIRAHTMLHI
jgi:hypothetical protein